MAVERPITERHPAEDRRIFIWRLTLACGHLKLWGPFLDGSYEKSIGDHTKCAICPPTKSKIAGVYGTSIVQMHLVVRVDLVNPYMCSPTWLRAGLEGVIE